MWHYYFARLIKEKMENARDPKGQRLSLRGFAKRIQTSPSVLSELIRNRRQLSPERSLEIGKNAGLTAHELEKLKTMMHSGDSEWSDRDQLSNQALSLITDPLYYKLICALEILGSPIKQKELESFLEADRASVSSALNTLALLDVVHVGQNGVRWSGRHVTTTNDIPNASIRSFHKATLRSAISDLSLPPSEREYTTVVFAANQSELQNAKGEIRHFRDLLAKKMCSGAPDRVYQLSIQLRPVSQKKRVATKQGDG